MPPAADGASLRWGTRAVTMEQLNEAVTELTAGRYTLPPELYVVGIRDLAALLREKAQPITGLTFGVCGNPATTVADQDEYSSGRPGVSVTTTTLHRLDGRLTRGHTDSDTRLHHDLADVQPGDIIRIGRGSKRPAEQVRVIEICPVCRSGGTHPLVTRGWGGTTAQAWRAGQRVSIVGHHGLAKP